MKRKLLAEKKWAYALYQVDRQIVLTVVCGGAAMYELNIPLAADEIKIVLESSASLDALVEKIRDHSDLYASRSVSLD